MADDTKNATVRTHVGLSTGKTARGVVGIDATVEVAADASAGSVYTMARIPSNARIHGPSIVYFDDLASTGSPTIDIGLKAVADNITTDDDALNDGIGVSAAAGSARVVKDIANIGKMAWEFAGASADPGGVVDVIVTIKDAATNTGGTISATLFYSVD